jgi:acyl-CoA thioester hydrolase
MDVDPELAAMLPDFPVIIAWPVQWGDMDAYQHVNNTVFFRWFETARIAYTSRLGLKDMMIRDRIGPILAAIACDYRRQVTFPDTVVIGSRVSRIGRTSFGMDHALVSADAKAVAAECRSTIVVFDYATGRPVPIPEGIRQAIVELEGRPL